MKIFILLLISMMLLSACQDTTESKSVNLASSEDPLNNSNDNDDDQNEVIDEVDDIIIEGPQVCYENESCHKVVHKSEIDSLGDYVYNSPSASLGQQYRKPSYFVDLDFDGTSEYVSPNFKRTEFMAPHKGRYGLLAPHFVKRVQNMRNSLGKALTVNSAYRGPAYNESIGGATWSRHMYGDALDFKSSGKTPTQLKDYCQAQGASYIQVYSTHVHCDWRNVSLAEEFYPSDVVPILAKAQTAELNQRSHLEFYDNILIHSEPNGESTQFTVEVLDAEDGVENLLIEWEVYLNNIKIKSLSAARMNINLEESGDYIVQVTVGGYWKKYKIISH